MSGKWKNSGCNCGLDLSKGKSGLGPNSWGNVRHILPYHVSFHTEASKHDKAYTEKKDKKKADAQFLSACLKEKEGSKAFAYLYYFLIKTAGFYYYNKKD